MDPIDDKTRTELEAAVFRRLVEHLRTRTDVQNIDLMNLAGFCRNCLSNWMKDAADAKGLALSKDQSREIGEPRGYGVIERVYWKLATAAGIEMKECRLLEDGGRRHFMTRRFDRTDSGRRLHMQSLAALGHLDFNLPGANSYEQAFQMIGRLGLGRAAVEQQFLRMVFNVVARNQDDHVKNIAFLMDRAGGWSLSPAFDLTWAYNPTGRWTSAASCWRGAPSLR